jgi:serine/threonine protein kinase
VSETLPLVDALMHTVTVMHGDAVNPDSTLPPPREDQTASSLSALPLASLDGDPSAGLDLEVLALLGEGGMGRVELARQKSLGRDVAIKTVRRDVVGAESTAALLTEARHAGRLEHPNIVPVHALARTADGHPVMVMKRVEGVAWRDLLQDPKHPFWARHAGDPLELHLDVFQQVCNAVHFAHSRGLVHRDVKPANVMLGEYGEVYLVDWGLAVEVGKAQGAAAGALVGTPAYMAPEMLDGSAPTGPLTDVYLLGATLHEALTGQRRHAGQDVRAVLASAAESAPVAYGESVPAELGAICNRATARAPADRFPSALALRDAVVEFRRHRGSLELAHEADRVFAALTATALPEDEVRRAVAEARLGYQQALRIWKDNGHARRALADLLSWMADFELSRRNRGAAASLLADLHPAPPALVARLEALDRELREAEAAAERLREVERQADVRVAWRLRGGFAAGILLFAAGLTALQDAGALDPSFQSFLGTNLGIFAAEMAAFPLLRRSAYGTKLNQQFLFVASLIPALGAIMAALFLALGGSVPLFLAANAVVSIGIVASFAMYLQPAIGLCVVGPLFVVVAVAVDPDRALLWQNVGFVLGAVIFLLVYRRAPTT